MKEVYDYMRTCHILGSRHFQEYSVLEGGQLASKDFAGRISEGRDSIDFRIALGENGNGDGLPNRMYGNLITTTRLASTPHLEKYGQILLPSLVEFNTYFKKIIRDGNFRRSNLINLKKEGELLAVSRSYGFDTPCSIKPELLGLGLVCMLESSIIHLSCAQEVISNSF